MNKTKWYWWVPILGLFFIEEITGWVWDSKLEEHKKRVSVYSYLWALHLISASLIIIIFILAMTP
jgi:predicted transglutaminase-like protease